MRKQESAKDKAMRELREVLGMCDFDTILYNSDNLILFRSYIIEFDEMLKSPESAYRFVYDNNLNTVVNMYIDLLLNITEGEGLENKSSIIQALKLKIYQNNLEDIKRDIVIKLAALKKAMDKKKFLFGERLRVVVNLINYYISILNNLTEKENNIYNNIDTYLKSCSELSDDEDKMSFVERRELLLAMIGQVMPDKVAEFDVNRLNKKMEVALMEQALEIYAYKNRAMPVVLEQELQALKAREDASDKRVQDLELQCKIFNLFGLSGEGRARMLKM